MTDRAIARERLSDALDRYGADFGRWPDNGLANEARRLAVADLAFRRGWNDLKRVEADLAPCSAALDREIEAAGCLARVKAGAVAQASRSVRPRVRWPAVAAAVVGGIALGGLTEFVLPPTSAAATADLVALDILVYGPESVDLP